MLEDYQDIVELNLDTTMRGTIIGMPGKHCPCWTICWLNHNFTPEIANQDTQYGSITVVYWNNIELIFYTC